MVSGLLRTEHRAILTVAMAVVCLEASAGPRWYVYRDCRLVEHPANDGDSFHVRTRSAEYIFRLYFVDAPECDTLYPERVAEQAQYWGLSTNRVIELGRVAAAFTRQFLSGTFTVRSKRENARGQSTLPRFYGLVSTEAGDLAEALVSRGLARVHGMPTSLPDGTPPEAVFARLRALEASARRQKLGAWHDTTEEQRGSAAKSDRLQKGKP